VLAVRIKLSKPLTATLSGLYSNFIAPTVRLDYFGLCRLFSSTYFRALQDDCSHEEDLSFRRSQTENAKRRGSPAEIEVMKAMEDLNNLDDEEEYKLALAEVYGILPGHPRYAKAIATWRDLRRGKP